MLQNNPGPNGYVVPTSKLRYGRWGFDLEGMNIAVRPGNNFYLYTNGSYLDKLVIPPERSVYTAGSALTDASLIRVRALLDDPAQGTQAGAGARAAADYFASFMDEGRIDGLGLAPLQPEMNSIRAAHARTTLASLMGQQNAGFFGSIFALHISPDLKNPTHYAVQIGQPDLGLPDRSYYLNAGFATERECRYSLKRRSTHSWCKLTTGGGSGRTRARSSSKPARPYI